MFVIKRLIIKSLSSYVRLYSFGKKSHYEVLKLRRNCTDKEIKQAFIQMSKEYHPDKNKDARAQEQFVKIVEAYNVLGKASSRAKYDILTRGHSHVHNVSSPYVYKSNPYHVRKNPHTYYYEASNQTQYTQEPKAEKSKSYYGVSGVKKLPNYMIIMICFGFAIVGLIVQLIIIRKSFLIHRQAINEKSKLAAEELEKVRAAGQQNGNELQTRLLLEKIVNAANPTVATASLGQALASEKKDSSQESLLTEHGVSDPKNDWYNASYRSDMKGNPIESTFESWFE